MYRCTERLPFFHASLCPADGDFFFIGICLLLDGVLRIGAGGGTGGELSSDDSAFIISQPSSSDDESLFRVKLRKIKEKY